jgi:hypothetical protein
MYAPEQRSGRDSTNTTERACWHENTNIAKEQIIWWRLITDDIEATIVQKIFKNTFPYGTMVSPEHVQT